jgi:transposase-like protein
VRKSGLIGCQSGLTAIAVNGDGRQQVLGEDLANRETASWRDFLLRLMQLGLHGVEYVVADDHPGLKRKPEE